MDDEENLSYLANLLHNMKHEEAADTVLTLMHQQNSFILNLCDDDQPNDTLSDIICQHVAEKGLKEILDTIKSEPIELKHLFSGSVLVAIKDLHIVKKYLWKDKEFISAMERLLKFSVTTSLQEFVLLRDIVAHIIQGTLLGGTPSSYTEEISKSQIIELYVDIFKNKHQVKSNYSYEEFLLSLLVLCQSSKLCMQKCSDLSVAMILNKFSQWNVLDVNLKEKAEVASGCIEHMIRQESLPDHKKMVLNKFSEHIHSRNKSCKGLETVVCSYSKCSKIQSENPNERFKKCGKCRVALYCSKDCQVAHWKSGHSKVCVSPS